MVLNHIDFHSNDKNSMEVNEIFLSSFTYPHVILNLYYFLSSVEHKMFEEYWQSDGFRSHWLP